MVCGIPNAHGAKGALALPFPHLVLHKTEIKIKRLTNITHKVAVLLNLVWLNRECMYNIAYYSIQNILIKITFWLHFSVQDWADG